MILVMRQSVGVCKVMREFGEATAQVSKLSGARMAGKYAWGFIYGLDPKQTHSHGLERNFAEGCYKIIVVKDVWPKLARSRRQTNATD